MSASTGRVTVVGLGPGDPSQVTSATFEAIERIGIRRLRTDRHPSAHLVHQATSYDELYESASNFDEVYDDIAHRLIADAAEYGEVLYAVPGSPLVLERTVSILRADPNIECITLPAISFLDAVWARLGIDPVELGVRLIDGHRFATEAAGHVGPMLVAHVHADWVLSAIKLAVDPGPDEFATDTLDATPVVVLHAIGTADEEIIETTWSEMDRVCAPDHLTSLWIPRMGVPVASGYQRFHDLARTLRERCPWDIEQTHTTLIPHLVEEAYEVVEAIDHLNPEDPSTDDELIAELGDLLYQIEFHATIAEQEGRFTMADVTSAIHDKLVRRHPHVFGSVEVADAAEVTRNWERIKAAERSTAERRPSVLDGVPDALPALAHSATVQRKAAKVGFDWPDVAGALAKVAEETSEVVDARASGDERSVRAEIGDLLFAVVNVARHLGVEPETALRSATDRFRQRFAEVERMAAERSLDLDDLDIDALDALWDEAKALLADRER
jgi:tetrapyrrole methylase family protein/MazG family protein